MRRSLAPVVMKPFRGELGQSLLVLCLLALTQTPGHTDSRLVQKKQEMDYLLGEITFVTEFAKRAIEFSFLTPRDRPAGGGEHCDFIGGHKRVCLPEDACRICRIQRAVQEFFSVSLGGCPWC